MTIPNKPQFCLPANLLQMPQDANFARKPSPLQMLPLPKP